MAATDEHSVEAKPEDPLTEAVPTQEALPPPPVKRRSGFIAPLLGGALAAGAGFALAQVVPNGWPLMQGNSSQEELVKQAGVIAELQNRLAALEGHQTPDLGPLMDTMAALNLRVAALETGPAERAEESAALAQTVAELQAGLAALQNQAPVSGDAGANVPTNLAALAAEAEARLKEAEAQAAEMKREAEALAQSASARAALGRLQMALDQGQPYAMILPDLGLDIPESLAAQAETGVPGLDELQASFPDAARQALEAALRADMGESWTERATSFLWSQTGARSLTPREGGDPDAVLSRAEAALSDGDLPATLAELDALPEASLPALAVWRGEAERRIVAQEAVKALALKLAQ